jgi:hypothetical protein
MIAAMDAAAVTPIFPATFENFTAVSPGIRGEFVSLTNGSRVPPAKSRVKFEAPGRRRAFKRLETAKR